MIFLGYMPSLPSLSPPFPCSPLASFMANTYSTSKDPPIAPLDATPSGSRAPSVGASSSNETRKTRRKNKKKKEKAQTQPEAGPSSPKAANPKESQGANSSSGSSTKNGGDKSFLEADFIPFSFDDEPEEQEEEEEPFDPEGKGKQRANSSTNAREPYAREWDKGKSRVLASDDRRHGHKRKVDEVDRQDGYDNKKQRADAASRRAPWVWDVDWENCRNVAEMYVLTFSYYGHKVIMLGHVC